MSSVRWPAGGAGWQSQQLSHTERKDMVGRGGSKSYSWWWDSHNAPKNSKWLEDNLNDMDAKVKAMLKLIEEDADSFAKRAEMYYKKRPELVNLVEEFYRAYRSLAERYDQLTGHVRQIPQEIQAQYGFLGDASPGSPGSGGSVRRRAAGFAAFGSSGTFKRSKAKGRKDGSASSSSSSSDSDANSKHAKAQLSDEMLRLQLDNEQLRKDLEGGVAHHQVLESRVAEIQGELKSLQQENVQLHRNAASAHSEIAALEAEIERLKRENRTLGEEHTLALRTAERLQHELEIAQWEQQRISVRLEEAYLTIQDLEARLKDLETRISLLSEELVSSATLCERQNQELGGLRDERSLLVQEVSAKMVQIQELEEEIARLKGLLSVTESDRDRSFEVHKTLERDLSDVHAEFSSVKVERGRLSGELLLKVQHVQSLEQQLIVVQEAMEIVMKEKEDLIVLLDTTESNLLNLQKEFQETKRKMREEISVQVNEKIGFQNQIGEVLAALEVLQSERSRGIELQALSEKRIKDLELELKLVQETCEACENEKNILVNEAENSILELRLEFDLVREKLNEDIALQVQEKQVLADQMVELSAALEESQGEQRRAAALQDVYEERILDLELQRKQNKEELESTEREKGELIGLLSKMENDWLNLQMEFSTVQKNLKIEISTLAEEKQSLQLRIEELEAVLAALHGERGKSVELQDVLDKKLVDYEQQLLQVQAALAVAEKERAAVGELLSNTELSLSALQEESKSRQIQLRGQLSLLAEENQSLTGQMEELQATLALLLSEKTRGIELHDVLEKRVLELQLELSQAKQEASTLSHELEGRVEAVSQLEDLIKSRDEAVSKLGADLELSIFETTRMREKLEDEFALIGRLEGEVEERGNQLVALREEISVKLEEGHVLKEQVDLLLEEKISLSKENSLHLVEIQKLKKELQEAAGTLSERAISIVNFEIQHKQFVEEREQKQVYHVQQYQVVTSNMERLELECAILREASHKLEIELTSKIQHAQQLELDLKVAEEAAIISLKEAEKLKVNLALETDRSSIAEEKSLLQEQVIVDFKKEKATLLARVEELEMRIQTLQEELEGFLAKIDHLRQEKESCDMEILALNDELSNVKVLSKEASSQFLETITALRKEKCQLEFNLANYIEELESFKKSQATWHTERGTILEAASQAANEREELQNTILIWRHRMEKLEMEHMTLRTTSKEIESSLLIHQTEYSRVHSEVSEKGNRIQWLEGELERLKLTCQGQLQEFEVKERSMESQILKCRVEIQDLDDVCKGLTKKLEIKNYEHEALKLNMQVTQETLDSTQLERDHLTMKCNSLQHEVLQEHEFRVAAEAGVSKHQAEITDLMAEIASLRTQLQQLVEEKQFLTEQMEELQATLAALHSDKTRGIELHDVLEKRVLELQLELSQAKQEASALSHDLAGRVEAVSKLECSIKSQDEIVSKLGADLGFSITESIRLRDELAGKLALIGRLEGEVEERGNQIAGLQQEVSIKVEEGHVLGNQADLLLEEKITLSKENSLLLVKIEWLKKELQEASESLSERASSIVNLEMQCKQFVEEFEQKQMYHLQQYQVVKGDMEKVELQYVIVQEAHSKLEIELASKVQHAQQLELDVKVAEKVATESMEEVAMLKVSVASETLRSKKAEERCLLLEQLILGIKEEKVRLLTRVEELEMRIKTLQEELEGFLVKIDQLRHGKEACDMEIVSLNDELSKVKMLSRQSSIQFTETISALRIEISKLEADLANRSEELQFFEKERSTWHTERGTILDTVSQAAKEKEEMENAILMWTQRTEKVEMEHMTLRTKSGEIESSLLFHQTEYNRVQSEVSEKGERIQWLERELKRLELTCEEHLQKFKIKEESMGDLCKELTEKLQGKSNEHETLKLNMQVTQETLCATQLERDNAILKCDSLQHELFQEHEFRVVAEAGVSRRQAEISELRAEIARLQIQLKELKDENNLLSGKLEAAMELEKTYAIEIEMLLKALHGSREWSGNSDVRELSWDFETKHAAKGKTSSFVHLKKSMLNLLADRSRIMEEAHVHVEHIKALNLEMEKSGQILQSSRGDYRILQNKHESALTELQALHLRIEQLERQLGIFEEEKRKLHDQLLASVRDSDNLSSVLMREKKELYEKLVSEGEHVLQLQQELKLLKNETVGNRRYMDNLQKDIEKLNLCIQEITLAKDEQERTLRDELQFYAEEKGVLAKNLNEAHGSLLVEKADVMRLKEKNNHQDQLLLKLESDIGLLRTNLFEKEALFTSSLSLAEQKVTDLLLQLGILTQEKENVFSELHEKDLLCSDKDGRIEKYLRQMESFELKLEDMKKHSAYMSQKYDATLAELESVRLQLSSLREENGRLGLDVLARTVSVTELTDTVSSIEQQNADLRVKLKKLQEDDLSLKQYNASLQVETEGLKQNLKSHAVKIGLLEEEIFKLREVHARLQSEHDCISTEWQLNLDKHHLTLSNLEKLQEELLFQRNEKERFEAELMSQYARIQELESTIAHLEREKLAFSVEIASTVVLMTETQRRADDLQEEIILLRQELTSSNERLQEKTERIKELLSLCGTIQEERAALGMELEIKIQAFGILDSSFCALKGEHSSLVDKYEFVTKEAAAGANLILKLQDEISRLSSEKGQIQVLMHRNADIQRLQQDLSLVQDSERQLRDVLDAKVKEISQLEEELDKLKAAKLVVYEEHTQKIRRLEVELKRMELVVIGFRDEKISLSEKNAQVVSKCSDLEATSKIIQQQLAGVQQERASFELQLSLIEALKQELHDAKEMVRLMQERVANKQHEIDQVQSINEDLKKITRKFEIEAENLRGQIVVLEKKNTLLDDELSTKASLVQVLDQSLTSLKNQKVVFEGGFALTVGNFSLVQVEIDKLLEKISKSNEQSVVSGEELRKMEDRICKLQVSNLNLRDEISGLAKKEKSYVIAVRFMRAEFFCLAERIKTMKEEKAEQTRLAELAMETERTKNGEAVSGLHRELAFLREENKRQRTIIFDRAEEKREAIRQLCATIDHMQDKNRRLEGVIVSVREKIQRRIAASAARRR